ncbi:BtrH N-terminal domain-containing protein [Streptomyces sp. NPDC050842]|uniref:BtrH N-terminal domain-containing protein n=1 Tax=Streptomyces sp. NPDC050842 TaxID=3365636 RepID=UPI0037A954C7
MLFGLGSGLSFVYWDGKGMPFPFLGGRVRPFELTRNLAAALDLELLVQETTSPRRAWQNVTGSSDAGRPVGLQLDSHHLDYFGSKVHFGGHVVALHGYDEHRAYLVDTEQQGGAVSTSLASLGRARAARGPMTAKLVRTWLQRTDDPRRDLTQTALLMEKGGTGGALFRNLYRDFLGACTQLVDSADLRTGHGLYAEAATGWTGTARLIAQAGESDDPRCLAQAGTVLGDLARIEREAMEALRRLRE